MKLHLLLGAFTILVHLNVLPQKEAEIIRVDTLTTADEWTLKDYSKVERRKSYRETKILNFMDNRIEIQQNRRKDSFSNRSVSVKGQDCGIELLYQQTYDIKLGAHYYLMANLVTAKTFENHISIDLVMPQNNCLGEFCNDVEILTLKFSRDGKFIEAYFHAEDFSVYEL